MSKPERSEILVAWEWPPYYMGKNYEGNYVLLSHNRDSGILEKSNYECAIRMLEEETENLDLEEDGFFTVCFNHWAVGWIETIMIPFDSPLVPEAENILCAIESYPVLDEHDYCEKEVEEVECLWRDMSFDRRLDIARDAGVSIFAIRHDEFGSEIYAMLREYLNY